MDHYFGVFAMAQTLVVYHKELLIHLIQVFIKATDR